MGAVFVLLAAAVIAVLAFGAVKARNEALNRAWSLVAEQLGLSFTPSAWNASPRLEGEIEGYPLSIDIHKRGSGRQRTVWTRFKLGVPSLPSGFELKREGFLSKISKVFGGRDIDVGDDAFDGAMHVKGRDAGAIRAFLSPARREHIRRFLEAYSGAWIDGQAISWSKRGRMSESSQLLGTVRQMLRLAHSLAEDEQGSEPSPVVDEPLREKKPTGPSDRQAKVEEVSDRPVETAPEDRETPGRAGESASDGESTGSLGVAAFSDAVFAPGKPSFEAARNFADHYQGKRIAWSGTLRSAEPYRFDFVFGSGPGVKATLTIPMVQATKLGDGELKVVIRLPAETEGLDTRIGKRVSFSGKLFKVDAFMKKVFVTDAALHGNGFEPASTA